ncbi:hypothetical protein GH754_05145 [Salinibacillus xinjiangensis]|uniref:Uncharacterized protein n=2 Tax=Salinibacillus xinjiangensis TaxID=1229268 RepID=A0A6G1X4B5_9BACI|nr:hypothetical protein [Salinibacillus xinjiangensis]
MLPLQLECTLYFENNPYAYETVDGLSVRLGRKAEDLEKILEHLVSLNIVEVIGKGATAIYHYNQPELVHGVEV